MTANVLWEEKLILELTELEKLSEVCAWKQGSRRKDNSDGWGWSQGLIESLRDLTGYAQVRDGHVLARTACVIFEELWRSENICHNYIKANLIVDFKRVRRSIWASTGQPATGPLEKAWCEHLWFSGNKRRWVGAINMNLPKLYCVLPTWLPSMKKMIGYVDVEEGVHVLDFSNGFSPLSCGENWIQHWLSEELDELKYIFIF